MTVNTVNNKIYIGVHITEKPYEFDNYYGCGINGTSSYWFKHPKYPFQKACKKYGLKCFKRYTLAVFDSYEEALQEEKKLVNEQFIKRPDVYNVALGGGSGLIPSTEVEVFQYSLDGVLINSYRSKQDAARKNSTSFQNIHYAILNKTEFNNSYWTEYKTGNLLLNSFKKKQNNTIYVYDSNGNFESAFTSITQFAKKHDVVLSVAQRALKMQTKCGNKFLSKEKVDKFVPETKKRIRHKIIYRYSKEGNFIDKMTFSEAKSLLKTSYTKLHKALSEHYQCCGYFWDYEQKPNLEIKNKKVKIGQYDLKGNLIKIWNSYRECEKEYSNMRFVLNGTRTQTKGFTFKRLEN